MDNKVSSIIVFCLVQQKEISQFDEPFFFLFFFLEIDFNMETFYQHWRMG